MPNDEKLRLEEVSLRLEAGCDCAFVELQSLRFERYLSEDFKVSFRRDFSEIIQECFKSVTKLFQLKRENFQLKIDKGLSSE